jgi:hypothetical protein
MLTVLDIENLQPANDKQTAAFGTSINSSIKNEKFQAIKLSEHKQIKIRKQEKQKAYGYLPLMMTIKLSSTVCTTTNSSVKW